MQITIELPEDIAVRFESKWKDLPRAALESLALELSVVNDDASEMSLARELSGGINLLVVRSNVLATIIHFIVDSQRAIRYNLRESEG